MILKEIYVTWLADKNREKNLNSLYCSLKTSILNETDENYWYWFWAGISPQFNKPVKALANEDTLLRTHCCRHKCFPVCPRGQFCCGHRFCVRDTKNVSDFVQKHFVSAANVSQFAQLKKHDGQQCVRNNVSSFTRTFTVSFSIDVVWRSVWSLNC